VPRVSDARVDVTIADSQVEADFVAICRALEDAEAMAVHLGKGGGCWRGAGVALSPRVARKPHSFRPMKNGLDYFAE